ncbi:MAG: hypothetical protein HYX51_03690 [Chloroflexi bacterium]|nr:hypothetical protein [Chloroflexota bacterium]
MRGADNAEWMMVLAERSLALERAGRLGHLSPNQRAALPGPRPWLARLPRLIVRALGRIRPAVAVSPAPTVHPRRRAGMVRGRVCRGWRVGRWKSHACPARPSGRSRARC